MPACMASVTTATPNNATPKRRNNPRKRHESARDAKTLPLTCPTTDALAAHMDLPGVLAAGNAMLALTTPDAL